MTNANDPINAVLDTNYREGVPILENRYEGLTKREYMATMAMQGLLACTQHDITESKVKELTRTSIIIADAMINELNTLKP